MVCTQLISSAVAPMPDWICTSELATIWISSMAMNWPMTIPPKPRNTFVQFTVAPSDPSITGTPGVLAWAESGWRTASVTGAPD